MPKSQINLCSWDLYVGLIKQITVPDPVLWTSGCMLIKCLDYETAVLQILQNAFKNSSHDLYSA